MSSAKPFISYALSLGSNIGDREDFLAQSVQLIGELIGNVTAESSLYQTEAWGKKDQAAFLNQVILVDSSLDPKPVLEICQTIESKLGRERFEKWGARKIDIDILYAGDHIVIEEDLSIPHIHLDERMFCLAPLAEIAPDLRHPVLNATSLELLDLCTDKLKVERLPAKV